MGVKIMMLSNKNNFSEDSSWTQVGIPTAFWDVHKMITSIGIFSTGDSCRSSKVITPMAPPTKPGSWFSHGTFNGSMALIQTTSHPGGNFDLLLMEKILHQLIWEISHYLQGLFIPGGAGFLPSTVFFHRGDFFWSVSFSDGCLSLTITPPQD